MPRCKRIVAERANMPGHFEFLNEFGQSSLLWLSVIVKDTRVILEKHLVLKMETKFL